MNKAIHILFVFFIILQTFRVHAQTVFADFEHLFTPERGYVAYRTFSEINIDGKSSESSWSKAEWTEYFIDIEGELKPVPNFQTRVKMLWDDQNLYILAELEEPNVWAYIENHDEIVYHENDFEVFIDPDSDSRNYFEIEINAQNTIFDLFMPKPYRNGGPPLISWNAPGLKSAIYIEGTINNPADTDKKWMVEMAIPFESLRIGLGKQVPEDGQVWRINFSRVQWQTEIHNGKYIRKKDSLTQRFLPENNWVWSPIGIINMHYPERWGKLHFSMKTAGTGNDVFQKNEIDKLKKFLWLVYYKQKKYHAENGKYATSLSELYIPEKLNTESGDTIQLEIIGTEIQFTTVINSSNIKLSINQDGLIQNNRKRK